MVVLTSFVPQKVMDGEVGEKCIHLLRSWRLHGKNAKG